MLGAGTVLAPIDALDDADTQAEARLCALLSAAYRQATSPTALRHIRRGAVSWRAGDKATAAMHLAMTGFPEWSWLPSKSPAWTSPCKVAGRRAPPVDRDVDRSLHLAAADATVIFK